jgi:uncharacterized membrane protein YgcG
MAFDQFGNYVPEWQDIGADDEKKQTPDLGPFAQALKMRFASNKSAGGGMKEAGVMSAAGKEGGGGFGGGGMKSLG